MCAGAMMMRLTAVLVLSLTAAPAMAASVTNLDGDAYVLTVVEGGKRIEVVVGAGETQNICPRGCFLTLPSGDRIGLTGDENIEIQNGAATIE